MAKAGDRDKGQRETGLCPAGHVPILARRRVASGWRAFRYCGRCGRFAFGGASYVPLDHLGPGVLETLPVVERDGQTLCEVCQRAGPVEQHHLAPRAIFGSESERWPSVWVCRGCHERWHAFMRTPGAKLEDGR